MKPTTLIVLGGLLFAGTTLAAEPQQPATGASLKIAIDPVTGKRRQMTAEESAALDAQAAQPRAKAQGISAKTAGAGLVAPATYEESAAGGVTRNGLTLYVAPLESYSHITATRDSDGKVTLSEDGQPLGNDREMARE